MWRRGRRMHAELLPRLGFAQSSVGMGHMREEMPEERGR